MYIILKEGEYSSQNNKVEITPVLYLDTKNEATPTTYLVSEAVKFIRTSTNSDDIELKKEDCEIKNIDELKTKGEGFYFILNGNRDRLELFQKEISKGYIYNSFSTSKLFTLYFTSCPKIIPVVPKSQKKNLTFDEELKQRVRKLSEERYDLL